MSIENPTQFNIATTVMFFVEKQLYEVVVGKFNIDYMLTDSPQHIYCLLDPTQPLVVYAYSMNEQIVMKVERKTVGSRKEMRDEKMSGSLFPILQEEDYEDSRFSQHQFLEGN